MTKAQLCHTVVEAWTVRNPYAMRQGAVSAVEADGELGCDY